MTDVFQVFKIIMGLIISVFVLYFLVNYAGNYATMQEDTQRAKVLRNFDKLSQDVYYTGIPADFEDFGKVSWPMLTFEPEPTPGIVTNLGKHTLTVPTLFKPGDDLVVSRATLDLGWWKFRMVEAMPEKRVIFNVLEPEGWEVVESVVEVMPSTLALDNKITFGFCDGPELMENFCGSSNNLPCEKDYFSAAIRGHDLTFSKCTREMPDNAFLVTVSSGCSPMFPMEGMCIEPPGTQGIGDAHMVGFTQSFPYKDGLDLAALIIGGTESGLFGMQGENLWEYKNRVFAENMGLAAELTILSTAQLSQRINFERSQGKISYDSSVFQCVMLYDSLRDDLNTIKDILEDKGYYTKTGQMTELRTALDSAEAIHEDLVNRGCEYI